MGQERKKILIVTVLPIALAGTGVWWFQARTMPVFFAKDAVHVLAYAASEMFHDHPAATKGELDQMIKSQNESSNINLKMDGLGRAVFPFGTSFRTEHQTRSGMAITTVTSVGPDREFGTGDDIRFKQERETKPQSWAGSDGEPTPRP